MNKSPLPNWQERQRLLRPLNKNLDIPRLIELGKLALAQGSLQDALEYFRAAKHQEGLDRLKEIALEEGDVFLLTALEKVAVPFDTDTWNKIGYRAFELGKYRFAKTAFERTQNELMLAKLAATLEPSDVAQPA